MMQLQFSRSAVRAAEYKLEQSIRDLWRSGLDTRDIASALRVRESWVANRLAWLRDQSINQGER